MKPRRGPAAGDGVDVRALADELGASLVRAVREAAADDFGRVRSGGGATTISWYAFALEYLEVRWGRVSTKTRNETNDALCSITGGLTPCSWTPETLGS